MGCAAFYLPSNPQRLSALLGCCANKRLSGVDIEIGLELSDVSGFLCQHLPKIVRPQRASGLRLCQSTEAWSHKRGKRSLHFQKKKKKKLLGTACPRRLWFADEYLFLSSSILGRALRAVIKVQQRIYGGTQQMAKLMLTMTDSGCCECVVIRKQHRWQQTLPHLTPSFFLTLKLGPILTNH